MPAGAGTGGQGPARGRLAAPGGAQGRSEAGGWDLLGGRGRGAPRHHGRICHLHLSSRILITISLITIRAMGRSWRILS